MKIKYKLTFLHKFLFWGLLVLAVVSFWHKEIYQQNFICDEQGIEIMYLQKGDYVLDISLIPSVQKNEIIVYSDEVTSENNHVGVQFLKEAVESQADRCNVVLHLEQDTHNIRVKTVMDTEQEQYINTAYVQSIQLQNLDNVFISLLCAIGSFLVLALGWFVPKEKYYEPITLVMLGLIASLPMFAGYALHGQDLFYHTARLNAVYKGLAAGEFPVYLGSTQMGGYGTLSATMYPQLFLYPFAMLRFARVSLLLCYKLLIASLHIGSAFASFYAAKKICKSTTIAWWTCVLYTFSIYRLTNVYYRAALGESLAMVFLPLIIWGLYEVFWGNYKQWYLLVLGVSGVIQSHVSTITMCLVFMLIELLVWLITSVKDKKMDMWKRMLAGIKAVLLTVLLNASFLVPFLFFSGENLQCFQLADRLSKRALYFSQMFSLFASASGSDYELGGAIGEMPHTVGILLIFGSVLLVMVTLKGQEKNVATQIGKRCLVYGAVALLLCSWLFPWDMVQEIGLLQKMASSLQFPWRFLGLASIFLCFAAAIGLVYFVKCTDRQWMYAVFIVLTICSTGYYFDSEFFGGIQYGYKMHFEGMGRTDAMYMYSVGDEYKLLEDNYNNSNAYITVLDGSELEYEDYKRDGMHLWVTVKNPNEIGDYLLFPLYHYPGYEILVNGEKVDVLSIDTKVACEVPYETAEIEVYYKGMPSFMVANIISLITILSIAIYNVIIHIRRKKLCLSKV